VSFVGVPGFFLLLFLRPRLLDSLHVDPHTHIHTAVSKKENGQRSDGCVVCVTFKIWIITAIYHVFSVERRRHEIFMTETRH